MTRSKELTLSLPGNIPVTCRFIHLDRQSFVYVSATGDLSFDSLAIAIPNTLQQGDVCFLCCVCFKYYLTVCFAYQVLVQCVR